MFKCFNSIIKCCKILSLIDNNYIIIYFIGFFKIFKFFFFLKNFFLKGIINFNFTFKKKKKLKNYNSCKFNIYNQKKFFKFLDLQNFYKF
ncbi:hypothetical protein NASMSEV_151 [Candidatus Nasuia deltocephalinicola]|uniref:Uncharacterized protein n=1 Tax=Candidatus Nasuia deltocephalincola TaxID=1160784 RepID=A0A7G6UHU7_9PROT|nr:hypothetical protein NASMSEV_151 [Candidatus Nasuia deltocephalinicola]